MYANIRIILIFIVPIYLHNRVIVHVISSSSARNVFCCLPDCACVLFKHHLITMRLFWKYTVQIPEGTHFKQQWTNNLKRLSTELLNKFPNLFTSSYSAPIGINQSRNVTELDLDDNDTITLTVLIIYIWSESPLIFLDHR